MLLSLGPLTFWRSRQSSANLSLSANSLCTWKIQIISVDVAAEGEWSPVFCTANQMGMLEFLTHLNRESSPKNREFPYRIRECRTGTPCLPKIPLIGVPASAKA